MRTFVYIMLYRWEQKCISCYTGENLCVYHAIQVRTFVYIMLYRWEPLCISCYTGENLCVYHAIQVRTFVYIMLYSWIPLCISCYTGENCCDYHAIQMKPKMYNSIIQVKAHVISTIKNRLGHTCHFIVITAYLLTHTYLSITFYFVVSQ